MAIAQLFRKVYNTDIKKKQGTGTAAEECCGYGEAGLYRKSAGGRGNRRTDQWEALRKGCSAKRHCKASLL